MRLLFITQKLHGQDAFGALWIRQFQRQGYDVGAICLEARPELIGPALGRDAVCTAEIHSLGKERGAGKFRQICRFVWLISTLRYDRVFIHMTPIWGLFGAPIWIARGTPVYLWYTHYTMQAGLWLLGNYAKRMFCATPQSLPQYQASVKKVVTGHGIDLTYWPMRQNTAVHSRALLAVHRLSRSKRLERTIQALALLPVEFTLDVYGMEAEPDYVQELRTLVRDMTLTERVTFHGTVPTQDLPQIYASHRLILNMAADTIDKTMLEAMTCGCYPVTTRGTAEAMGIPAFPSDDTAEAIRDFVLQWNETLPQSAEQMYETVKNKHSLEQLIARMDAYIRPGR